MILTDYYQMDKLPDCKSKLRLDCTTSTNSYPEFEQMRNKAGKFFFYFGDRPDQFGGNSQRQPDKAITRTKNISGVYIPDVTAPYGYGDVRGTNDALLFVFNSDFTAFSLLVARGQKNNARQLYTMLVEGELSNDIARLKEQAKTE